MKDLSAARDLGDLELEANFLFVMFLFLSLSSSDVEEKRRKNLGFLLSRFFKGNCLIRTHGICHGHNVMPGTVLRGELLHHLEHLSRVAPFFFLKEINC